MELRNGTFFFSRLPRSRLGGLAFAVLTCFLLVGVVASSCGDMRGGGGGALGRLLRPVVSPRFKGHGCRFTWSPGLFLLELLPPSRSGCGSYHCPSCSSHPSSAWFSLNTSASWVSTVASAPDSDRAFTFGSFSLLGIQLGLVSYRGG